MTFYRPHYRTTRSIRCELVSTNFSILLLLQVGGHYDECVCLFVCLSVRERISETRLGPSLHVGGVVLCTSAFVSSV